MYSKIASSYDRPSQNDLDNLKLVVDEFDNLKNQYDRIMRRVNLDKIELKSYEEFIGN